MLKNLWGSETKNIVHCEMNGQETSIDKTRVLTKISGIINLKLLDNPKIDFEKKIIYSSGEPPYNFFTKLQMPDHFNMLFGDLYATVEDIDEIEQSTHILSDDGMNEFMFRQLVKLIAYLNQYKVLDFSGSMVFVSANEASDFNTKTRICENWGTAYEGLGNKFKVKRILDSKIEKQTYGIPGILISGYDVAISDCSEKNPKGIGYLFKTDRNFTNINLCSNESAVDYCKKNNSIIYYTDFMNKCKMRIITKYTESINMNLQNVYKYRSSNI